MLHDESTSNVNTLSQLAHRYQLYLQEHENETAGEDEFMRSACNVLHMTDDLVLFVQSYRSGDAIDVIKGYEWYAPV